VQEVVLVYFTYQYILSSTLFQTIQICNTYVHKYSPSCVVVSAIYDGC